MRGKVFTEGKKQYEKSVETKKNMNEKKKLKKMNLNDTYLLI